MLIAEAVSEIQRGSNETVWAVVAIGSIVVAAAVVILLLRWVSFQLGFHLVGRFKDGNRPSRAGQW